MPTVATISHDLCLEDGDTGPGRPSTLPTQPPRGPPARGHGVQADSDRFSVSPRLATQWGLEDEEEAAPERHGQERDRQLETRDQDGGSSSPDSLEQEKL